MCVHVFRAFVCSGGYLWNGSKCMCEGGAVANAWKVHVAGFINVKSTDHLHVDEIGRNHPHVDATSKQGSGINILQKTFVVLLNHLNRLNNTRDWVGSIFTFILSFVK